MMKQEETNGIYGELRKRVESGMSAEKAVDSLLRSTSKSLLAEFVRPLLEKEARRYARFETTATERKVNATIRAGGDPVIARKELLDLEFWVDPDVRWVSYRDSTPEHHDRRAAYQEKHAQASLADAKFHRAIAKDMRATGAATFEELTAPVRNKHLRRAKAFAAQEVGAEA